MRSLSYLISLSIALSSQAACSQALRSISELQWKNRVILLDGTDAEFTDLTKNESAIDDRNIVWFLFDDQTVSTNSEQTLSESLAIKLKAKYFDGDISVILIGKDGGVKSRQIRFDLYELLSLIDTMPMRIQEMSR